MNTPLAATLPPPWYRQGWPWFLISIPLVSVLLGILMIVLATNGHDALVVDDWYKEGKGINQRIERDGEASRLGLAASLVRDPEGLVLELDAGAPAFDPPATLDVRWVHATRAERDGAATFRSIGGNRYVASGTTLPEDGRWRLHVEPGGSEGEWRLVSDALTLDGGPVPPLVAAPPGGGAR